MLRDQGDHEPTGTRKLSGAELAEESSEGERSARTSFVKLRLFGSRAWNAKGLNATGGASHYLLGDQPDQWLTDVPHYARVKAAGVYEGIDVVFYGREGVLEYDFVVTPGADPRQIQLDGAAKVQLDDKSGDLLLTTSNRREVRMGKPKVYQEMGGRKLDVKSSYQINGRATFRLADYDQHLPPVIDPTVMFTKFSAPTLPRTAESHNSPAGMPRHSLPSAVPTAASGTSSSLIMPPFTGHTLMPKRRRLPRGPTSTGEGCATGATARESPLITTTRPPPFFHVHSYTSGVA